MFLDKNKQTKKKEDEALKVVQGTNGNQLKLITLYIQGKNTKIRKIKEEKIIFHIT